MIPYTSMEDLIRASVLTKEQIARWLDPQEKNWAKFDPVVGYTLGNYLPRDGLDGSLTISTAAKNGARTATVYAQRPCRINTYGNSFTQCHQVSDQETWQEYLAAHLGEPIRNFGMGGFGVYQTYRRMIRTEQGPDGAPYLLFYIWGDDHQRSMLRCRWTLTHPWFKRINDLRMFHGNFWANIELDLHTGKLAEKENRLATPEALYQMADPEFMVQALRDDLMLQLSAVVEKHLVKADLKEINRVADVLHCQPVTAAEGEEHWQQVCGLRDRLAFSATKYIIDRAENFARTHGKRIMFILFCPYIATKQLIAKGARYDQEIADYLRDKKLRYFDMNVVQAEDFKCFNLSLDDYYKRYFIGHYSPAGNHFFAFKIKEAIVDWLDPKPVTYRTNEEAQVDFAGYISQG